MNDFNEWITIKMKTIEELIDEISKYVMWNDVNQHDSEAKVKEIIIDYAKQEVEKRDEQWKSLFESSIYTNFINDKMLPEPEFE